MWLQCAYLRTRMYTAVSVDILSVDIDLNDVAVRQPVHVA